MEETGEKTWEGSVWWEEVLSCIKARDGIKESEKFKSQSDLGKGNTGLGALHVVMREGEAGMRPSVAISFLSCQRRQTFEYLSLNWDALNFLQGALLKRQWRNGPFSPGTQNQVGGEL